MCNGLAQPRLLEAGIQHEAEKHRHLELLGQIALRASSNALSPALYQYSSVHRCLADTPAAHQRDRLGMRPSHAR